MRFFNGIMYILIIILAGFHCAVSQNTLNVGPGRQYANPAQAANAAQPGDTILIHPANYTGTFYIENLKGTSQKWITIKGTQRDQVIFQGGTESLHFTDAQYVHMHDFTVTGQTGNGMNIDDGGSYDTPTKHLRIEDITFRNMAASGNNDMLKLSGLDSFTVMNCHFENGSAGGSGVDMVGCHYGSFIRNRFINQGSNSIQAKGGSSNIHIERNHFTNGGQRSLNLGGSTGAAFFRPVNANYEAKDLLVTANIFEGSDAPIAFVGCRNVQVINNTIIHPVNWIMRILQESSDTSFYLSSANNTFSNNIVVVSNTLRTDVNIGPNTSPATFKFSNNLWYHSQNANWNGPQLPAPETNGIVRMNPLFKNFNAGNYSLANNSPAIGKGRKYTGYVSDYSGKPFEDPPAIGAFEKDLIGSVESDRLSQISIYPNPCKDQLVFKNFPVDVKITIRDLNGKIILYQANLKGSSSIDVKFLVPGPYLLSCEEMNEARTVLIVKI